MQERRNEQRSRTFLAGRIGFGQRFSTVECVVRNMSESGAKIEFPGWAGVPADFEVTIPNKSESRRARTVWRTGTQAGIAFLRGDSGPVFSLESARQIRQLAADRARLARRVAQLCDPA